MKSLIPLAIVAVLILSVPALSQEEKEPEMITTDTGLKYADLKTGVGPEAAKGDRVKVHYTGWLADNDKKFDSSLDRGQPFTFNLGRGQVIKGWDQGVVGMQVGGKRLLIIPAKLGYGNRGAGNGLIPGGATLKFEVELLGIE